jgi:hypothetical protein
MTTEHDDVTALVSQLPVPELDAWTMEAIRKNTRELYLEHNRPSPLLARLDAMYTRLEPAMVACVGLVFCAWAVSRAMGLIH